MNLSLSARIVALVLITSGFLSIGMVLTVYQLKMADHKALITEREIIDIKRIGAALATKQQQRKLSLESLASRLLTDKNTLKSPEILHDLLQQPSVAGQLFPDGLLVFDAHANAIAESITAPGRLGTNYQDRLHFQKALATKAAVISEPIIGRATGLPLISFLQPVLSSDGDVIAYAGGILDLANTPLMPADEESRAAQHRIEFIIDPVHRLFVSMQTRFDSPHPLPEPGMNALVDAALTLQPAGTVITYQDQRYLMASQHLHSPNWIVVRAIPYRDVIAPAQASFYQFLMIALLATVVVAWLAAWLARNLTRPLVEMTVQIEKMVENQLLDGHFPDHDSKEVSALTWAMNRLLGEQKAAKKAILHAERLLSNVLSAASEIAIIATDKQGIITVFNKGAENMLGYSAHELLNQQSPALLHTEQEVLCRAHELTEEFGYPVAGFHALIAKAERDGSEKREWTYVHKDGHTFPVSLIVTTIRDDAGEIVGFLGVADDITERKRLDAMKSEFISTVSHELRTPLTSISGALGLILGGRFGELSETAKTLLSTAQRNSTRLAHLINDLLDIEKMTAGKLHFDIQNHAVGSLLEQALDANHHYGAGREVVLALTMDNADSLIRVDAQRFMQVMANLLSNAIKFSPTGALVTLSLTTDSDRLTISVMDQGPGIPAAFHQRIFQRFAQADASDTRATEGTGLGLAITRELVEHMNGTIGFESTEGNGSRFFVQFPIVAQAVETQWPDLKHESLVKPRILVVEDDQDVANLLAIMLSDAGYDVDQAHNGGDALKRLANTHYHLLSLDLMLPDISGLEIIRQLREQPQTVNLPILVISAKMEQGRMALNGHANHIEWLAKPIDQHRLIEIVGNQLSLHEHHRPRLLHIEDDDDLQIVISAMLIDHFDFKVAKSLAEGRYWLKNDVFDLVLLDIGLPDGSGWTLLPDIHQYQPKAKVMVLSGMDMAQHEIDQVEDVLLKSRIDREELLHRIEQAIIQHRP